MRERNLRHPHVSSDRQSNEWVSHLRLGGLRPCSKVLAPRFKVLAPLFKVLAPRWARACHFWPIR
jgi:hypothetical protein